MRRTNIWLAIPMAGYEDTLYGTPVAFYKKRDANEFIVEMNQKKGGATWKLEHSIIIDNYEIGGI